jgi:universal stress protein A
MTQAHCREGDVEMQGYQYVLLAADLSQQGEAVGTRAVQLASTTAARMGLIHVVEHVPMDFPNDIVIPEQLDGVGFLVDYATGRLAELARSLGIPDAPRWVEVGSAKREITRVAAEQQVDLIVVGSHGRHGLGAILGSTADGVLHHAHCDVLAVRIKR